MNADLISVVTTLFNYKHYIPDLIKSVLKQSYSNWELIIIDDASLDNPYEVIQPYLKDGRIFYYRLNENSGYSVAKNEGIIRTKGDYIVMIDADDMLTPNSIEIRHKGLKQTPDKLWCHSGVLVRQADGSLSKNSHLRRKKLMKKLSQEMDLRKEYHHRLIHAQSVMVRREFHKRLGLYDETLRFSSDNEMWRRAIRFGFIPLFIDDIVSIYRAHDSRMSRSEYKKKRIKKTKKYIISIVEQRFNQGISVANTRILK